MAMGEEDILFLVDHESMIDLTTYLIVFKTSCPARLRSSLRAVLMASPDVIMERPHDLGRPCDIVFLKQGKKLVFLPQMNVDISQPLHQLLELIPVLPENSSSAKPSAFADLRDLVGDFLSGPVLEHERMQDVPEVCRAGLTLKGFLEYFNVHIA